MAQVMAPWVTVVLSATQFVTLERRRALFEPAMAGEQATAVYGRVCRGYRCHKATRVTGGWMVQLEPAAGDCGVDARLDSSVYRTLYAALTQVGFLTTVGEEGQQRRGGRADGRLRRSILEKCETKGSMRRTESRSIVVEHIDVEA